MRFNSKEIARLGQQAVGFDKEGILWMKTKSEGIFKRGEAFVQRLVRLRGNVLFYFKNSDVKHDPLGILVLERCAVELDCEDERPNSFKILFEGDEHMYSFAADSEDDRDNWIQLLHIASYECLKMQLQSLREQIQSKTGKDPVTQNSMCLSNFEYDSSNQETLIEEPALEMSLSCSDLPNDVSGQPPNPFIVLQTILPPQQTWMQHSHTEIVETNSNPQFLKTLGFGNRDGVDTSMRVKLTVYHVKERMTCTMSQLGMAIFTLQDLLVSEDLKLVIPLQGPDVSKCGKLNINGWINKAKVSVMDINLLGKVVSGESDIIDKEENRNRKVSLNYELMKSYSDNIITRTFRFDTNDSCRQLIVHEYLCECKWSYDIPIQLLNIWIDEEKEKIKLLKELGELTGEWRQSYQEMMDISYSLITQYTQTSNYLSSYKGPSFKASTQRCDKEVEFVPINLHLQRMSVSSNDNNIPEYCYDVITVGAFAAHCMRFRGGGLRRLLQAHTENYSAESTLCKTSKLDRACETLNTIARLKCEIEGLCEKLCQTALQGSAEEMKKVSLEITESVKDLVQECDCSLLQQTADRYTQVKPDRLTPPGQNSAPRSQSMPPSAINKLDMEKDSWRWTGTNFVRSPTVEPWDITRLNTEAAAVCLLSIVDDLLTNERNPTDVSKWLGEISQAVIKLQSFLEIVYKKASILLSFLSLMENRGKFHNLQSIKYRRDVLCSHAVTTAVSGFIIKLISNIRNEEFLHLLSTTGVLLVFTGLLSCFHEEMGHLEDWTASVSDLSHLTFRFQEGDSDKIEPTITSTQSIQGNPCVDISRCCLVATITLPKVLYFDLPEELRSKSVTVTPVIFNVGINEQATLAEKFGDVSLQDRINAENVQKLYDYYQVCQKAFNMQEEETSVAGSLSDLFQQLHYNVLSRKSKNVEILRIASEICRKLTGINFTSCKSAKDRTAMAVTLDQVLILQQQHDLASHVFTQALDCFRSEGVRRENTYKNAGARKYAFNSLQLLHFPKLYRPPKGTFGNVQS